MTAPDTDRLFAALDATWPPARVVDLGPWRLREGSGGGQRVSAATAEKAYAEYDIATAEVAMRDIGQRPLFMIRAGDGALDARLDQRGYEIVDPVTVYLGRTERIAQTQPPSIAVPAWPPLAIQRELWAQGGIGEARIAVMERAGGAKTALLCRHRDTPAAVVFAALDDDIAMLHALEVVASERRAGLAEMAVRAVAAWALKNGGRWLVLAVTRANRAANALYRKLAMQPVAAYHYRRAPERSA